MALVKTEELSDEVARILLQHSNYVGLVEKELTFTIEEKLNILNKFRDHALAYGEYYSKSDRPWCIIPDYFNRLDETQSWMGFEFESDWNSREARREAVSWVWDNIEGCCFDPEGSSMYSTEITLPPQEVSKYVAEEAEFQKMMKGLCALDDRGLGYQKMSGTHVNISTPAIRNDVELCQVSTCFLNNSMSLLTPTQRATLFSRSPTYGGAVHQENYIELKVFRSTYSYEQFQQYVKRSINIIKLLEAFEKIEDKGVFKYVSYDYTSTNIYCVNFFDVVNEGAYPVFDSKEQGFKWPSYNGGDDWHVMVEGEDWEYWSSVGLLPYDDYADECACIDCRRERGEDDEYY